MSRRQARFSTEAVRQPDAEQAQSQHPQVAISMESRQDTQTSIGERLGIFTYVCVYYISTYAYGRARARTHTHTHTGLTRAAAVLRSKLHGKSLGEPLDRAEPAIVPPLNFSSRRLGGGQDSRAAQASPVGVSSPMDVSSLSTAKAMGPEDDDQYFRYV